MDTLRVGLIADTHMPGTISALWPQVYQVFDGVDCILHAGDLHTTAVIEELEQIAPTFVACGNGDVDVIHPRLEDCWVASMAGSTVGMVHRFPSPGRASATKLEKKLRAFFPDHEPDVVIYGHTHQAEVHNVAGRVFVNPGSATLPNNQSTRLGTLGLMHLAKSEIRVELLQLGEAKAECIMEVVA